MATTVEGLPVQQTEVMAKAARRRFTAAEKLRVLKEADRCTRPGELSALLRREGLYSSHLSSWREARRRGEPGPSRMTVIRREVWLSDIASRGS